jgi:two-component system copper resistance phosphate regulon response regulator CusR
VRILLAEDESRVANFIAKGLREQTYAVDIAADGEQAVYQATVNEYDLMILDVMLPVRTAIRCVANCAALVSAHRS